MGSGWVSPARLKSGNERVMETIEISLGMDSSFLLERSQRVKPRDSAL